MKTAASPSLRCLKAFHAVVTLGSVSAAADQLSVTQPAISHLLRTLEATTGLKLFQKSGRQLQLSEDGRLYFEEIANGLHVLQELENSADAIRSARLGHVRLVCQPVAADHFIPGFLAAFANRHPDIQITLEVAERHRALPLLESGAVDLGLIAGPIPDQFQSLGAIRSEATCIIPAAWAEELPASASVDYLLERPFIALCSDSPFRQMLERTMEHGSRIPSARIQVRTQSAAAALVRRGAGYAIVDKWVADANNEGLSEIRLSPDLGWEHAAIARRRSSLSTAATTFVEELLSEAGSAQG